MTNTEKLAKELGHKYARQYHHNNCFLEHDKSFVYSNEEITAACIAMAYEQMKEDDAELVDTCLKSYNNGAHDAFVQVYEWLRSHIRYVECMENPYAAKITRMTADQFADFFKQTIEN